jgi:hypothetical protein
LIERQKLTFVKSNNIGKIGLKKDLAMHMIEKELSPYVINATPHNEPKKSMCAFHIPFQRLAFNPTLF